MSSYTARLLHVTMAVGWLLASAGPIRGQVNTERLRRLDDTQGVFGSATADFSVRTGNVEVVLIGVGARLDYGAARWSAFVVGSTDFGWQGGERFSNQALLHLRGNYRASARVSPEGFVQVNYDKSRRLDVRGLVGAGIRVTLLQAQAGHVIVGTSYMFEHERLDLPASDPHPDRTDAHRWSSYVTARVAAGQRLAFVATSYAQPRLDDFGDLRILADARLTLQLVGQLSLTAQSTLRYDRKPPEGIATLDMTSRTGFAVEW